MKLYTMPASSLAKDADQFVKSVLIDWIIEVSPVDVKACNWVHDLDLSSKGVTDSILFLVGTGNSPSVAFTMSSDHIEHINVAHELLTALGQRHNAMRTPVIFIYGSIGKVHGESQPQDKNVIMYGSLAEVCKESNYIIPNYIAGVETWGF